MFDGIILDAFLILDVVFRLKIVSALIEPEFKYHFSTHV